jgi:hypothetical protein
MRENKILFIFDLLLFVIIINGCNNDDFSPYINLENKIESFCILDSRLNSQYVRVQQIYLNSDFKKVNNANVVLSENNGKSYSLQETMLEGYNNYSMFVLPNYLLKRGSYYRLTVTKDTMTQYAETYIPPVTKVTPVMKLDTIWDVPYVRFTFRMSIPKTAPKVNSVRVFLDYDKNINGSKINQIIQIPVYGNYSDVTTFNFGDLEGWRFEVWAREPLNNYFLDIVKDGNSPFYKDGGTVWNIIYSIGSIMYLFNEIAKECDPKDITIKGAFAVLYSMDEYYFNNFVEVKSEQYSVRLDLPFESFNFKNNSGNGIGLFSSITADTTRFNVDKYFINRFGFTNGQK